MQRSNRLNVPVIGLLSSMYAFAPAFGFALSAGVTSLYTTIVDGTTFEHTKTYLQ